MCDVRGNVDTRLRKLDAGEFDALVLAEAGLTRLGLADRITFVFPSSLMIGAVGQGALGIECRLEDQRTTAALSKLDHRATHACIAAERALLAMLHGGCSAPIAGSAQDAGQQLELVGLVLSIDGRQRIEATRTGSMDNPVELGQLVGQDLIAQGAPALIAESRDSH